MEMESLTQIIYKFSLQDEQKQLIEIPYRAEVLSVGVQKDNLVLYARCEGKLDEEHPTRIGVIVLTTEQNFVPVTTDWTFMGTHFLRADTDVLHVWIRELMEFERAGEW